MLKKIIIPIAVFLVMVSTVYAGSCSGGSGNIWALHADGSSEDYFSLGEKVYLGGQNFKPNTEYYYELLDILDNKTVETSGHVRTDANGDIIVEEIWTIPLDDYAEHDYRIDLVYNECIHKIYTKKDSFETIPEFPTTAIPAIMALGGYLAMRVKSRKE